MGLWAEGGHLAGVATEGLGGDVGQGWPPRQKPVGFPPAWKRRVAPGLTAGFVHF